MKQSADILCVMLTYQRNQNLPIMLEQVKSHSFPMDLVIWNNNSETISFPGENIDIFQGINGIGLHQRFLPPLIYPHKYIFFLDDDVVLGRDFCQRAIEILYEHPQSFVVSAGHVVTPGGRKRTKYVHMNERLDHQHTWRVDIGALNCALCFRKHLCSIMGDDRIPPMAGNEIHFSAFHQMVNGGEIILANAKTQSEIGIQSFIPSSDGLMYNKEYQMAKWEYLDYCTHIYGWKPNARQLPEWGPNGAASLSVMNPYVALHAFDLEYDEPIETSRDRLTKDMTDENFMAFEIKPGDSLISMLGEGWEIIYGLNVNKAFRERFPDPDLVWPGFFIYRPRKIRSGI